MTEEMSETSDLDSSTARKKDENHIRIKAMYKGQCTLLGFERGGTTTVRDLVSKTCERMHVKPVTDYALFVAHGKTNIRVFECSDLKDGDVCELVQVQDEEDEDDEEELTDSDDDDDDDDDDKTVPMSVEKFKQESPSPTRRKRKIGSNEEVSIRSPRRRKIDIKKNSNFKATSSGLLKLTKKNQYGLERNTVLLLERYSDGHFHEAVFKKYIDPAKQPKSAGKCWVFVYFIDRTIPEKQWPRNWVDLNSFRTFILDENSVITIKNNKKSDNGSFLGKRLRVQWKDEQYYDGTVTKTLTTNPDFVYIVYDDGDCCWSYLTEELDAFELPTDSPVKRKNGKNGIAKNGIAEEDSDSSGDEGENSRGRGMTLKFRC